MVDWTKAFEWHRSNKASVESQTNVTRSGSWSESLLQGLDLTAEMNLYSDELDLTVETQLYSGELDWIVEM